MKRACTVCKRICVADGHELQRRTHGRERVCRLSHSTPPRIKRSSVHFPASLGFELGGDRAQDLQRDVGGRPVHGESGFRQHQGHVSRIRHHLPSVEHPRTRSQGGCGMNFVRGRRPLSKEAHVRSIKIPAREQEHISKTHDPVAELDSLLQR